jgi:hypothetical protein
VIVAARGCRIFAISLLERRLKAPIPSRSWDGSHSRIGF